MIGLKGWISVLSESPGALRSALNENGWVDDEVVAAGELRQGRAPTTLGMITGHAVVELAKPRRSKELPRCFVLALTADRVLAFKCVSGGGGSDSGPFTVRIRPGVYAEWPRSSVRLLDLQDGELSKDATLDLAGEQFPVSRPNLTGADPDTDELMHLLGGGVAPAREQSPKKQRKLDDHDELRRAAGLRPDDYRALIENAERGRPDFDLSAWAACRGLDFRGGMPQSGHLSITCPWSKDVLFNVVRGHWPGGTYGVLCHETRMLTGYSHGIFHGGAISEPGMDWKGLLNPLELFVPLIGSDDEEYFRTPYTTAGSRVPHLATITGVHVARRAERHVGHNAVWTTRPLDDLGLDGHWVAAIRRNSDQATAERLLAGPVRELLREQQGLGFELRIEYGQAIVARQDYLRRDEDLDALVAAAERLATEAREICVPRYGARQLDCELDPPDWLAAVREQPGKQATSWPIGALVNRVVAIADERGLAVEDPLGFHAAFPGLNVPGQAFGVLRGTLPGTSLSGRLVSLAERRMWLPDGLREHLTDPGGQVGADAVVLAVDPATASTAPEGELEGDVRVAVAGGVLTAWRKRDRWQADREALDRLAADVAAIVRRRAITLS
ncbi:MAG: hypothetical protein ACXVRH_00995 [Thermoleophilaceae bacterium]